MFQCSRDRSLETVNFHSFFHLILYLTVYKLSDVSSSTNKSFKGINLTLQIALLLDHFVVTVIFFEHIFNNNFSEFKHTIFAIFPSISLSGQRVQCPFGNSLSSFFWSSFSRLRIMPKNFSKVYFPV